jgi:N-methylhydantoinase B
VSIDPVELQVLTGALRAICEEMGAVLIRSAHSANIKERRDASTALFDPRGEMVMQAEHIPVHLGAMPAAVAAVLDEQHAPDRSWILNDPYRGGTHLPDITVITPVFAPRKPGWRSRLGANTARFADGELIAFAANRAHHADVGGPTPGSTPADSRTLADEGVVISPRVLDEEAIAELSSQMRQPDQRRADLRAQLAAGRVGVRRLVELHDRVGADTLEAAFAEVLDYAERRTRACLSELDDGVRRARDLLEAREGDLQIVLEATVTDDRLTLDFTGSAEQHDGNLNCPLAVTRSACYFAVRVLTDPEIPPSAGAYRPIEVIAPEGCLLNARSPAAVVGGNVETSSRIADVVLRAFGRAVGQGTMNNVVIGSEEVVYYETVGGGQGACPDADGPSGIHVAMSNTLNTPIEALELEFPLRMIEYSLRRGTGGGGAHRGGDGVVRELEALAPLRYSLLTERRRHAPPGADGGEPGAPGRNLLDGEELPPKVSGELAPGQRLRVETPGGGGFGTSRQRESPNRESPPGDSRQRIARQRDSPSSGR